MNQYPQSQRYNNTMARQPNYMGSKNSYNQYNSNNNSQQVRKSSGAKLAIYTPVKGKNSGQKQYLVSAWRLQKGTLISIKAVTTSKSQESEKGWFGSVAVSFTDSKTGASHFHWGMMQKTTGKVVIQTLGVVLNPKAPNGGYAGSYLKKK